MGFWTTDFKGTTMEPYYKAMRDKYGMIDVPQAFVDIIIPNGGGEKMARGVYDALRTNGESINFRVFPVSQGDHGANEFWTQAAAVDDRVYPILNEWNKPVPHAYNQAYLMTTLFKDPAPFIFTMDDDTRLNKPDWLDYLLWLRNSYPNPEEIGISTYGSSAIGRTPPKDGFWLEEDVGWDSNLLSRQAFNDLGLANESYCWHHADSDICKRLVHHRGYKILLGKEINRWRGHIGRVGSSQLGFKEEWWRAMSIQLGGVKWSNMPVKGVGSDLVNDEIRSERKEYPREGWWFEGKDFYIYNHGLDIEDAHKFPFYIDDQEENSCTDFTKDVNLMAYKVYRRDNPSHAFRYDEVVSKLYGISNVGDFMETVDDF